MHNIYILSNLQIILQYPILLIVHALAPPVSTADVARLDRGYNVIAALRVSKGVLLKSIHARVLGECAGGLGQQRVGQHLRHDHVAEGQHEPVGHGEQVALRRRIQLNVAALLKQHLQ